MQVVASPVVLVVGRSSHVGVMPRHHHANNNNDQHPGILSTMTTAASTPCSTSPNVNPTGHISMCDAGLQSPSHMQVVASPMGVCCGEVLTCGIYLPRHHLVDNDNNRHTRILLTMTTAVSTPCSTSPNVNPTGHASVCNASLHSPSCMQVVAGPMGVCQG